MTGRVVAVANMKGGVGKTTSTIMLAEGLSLLNAPCGTRLNKVLLVDTDPQSSLGYVLLGYDSLFGVVTSHKHVSAMLSRSVIQDLPNDFKSNVVGPLNRIYGSFGGQYLDGDLSLLATAPEMIHAERMVVKELTRQGMSYPEIRRRVLRFFRDEVLAPAKDEYDWIIVDCAPGLNMLTQSAISLADGSVVVTVPEPMSLFGLEVFLSGVWGDNEDELPKPKKPMVLAARVTSGQVTHAQQLGLLQRPGQAMASYRLLETTIPERAKLEGNNFMATSPMTLVHRYGSTIAHKIVALAAEVKEIVDGN